MKINSKSVFSVPNVIKYQKEITDFHHTQTSILILGFLIHFGLIVILPVKFKKYKKLENHDF